MGHQNVTRFIESSPYGEIQRPPVVVEKKLKKTRATLKSLEPLLEMSKSNISLP